MDIELPQSYRDAKRNSVLFAAIAIAFASEAIRISKLPGEIELTAGRVELVLLILCIYTSFRSAVEFSFLSPCTVRHKMIRFDWGFSFCLSLLSSFLLLSKAPTIFHYDMPLLVVVLFDGIWGCSRKRISALFQIRAVLFVVIILYIGYIVSTIDFQQTWKERPSRKRLIAYIVIGAMTLWTLIERKLQNTKTGIQKAIDKNDASLWQPKEESLWLD